MRNREVILGIATFILGNGTSAGLQITGIINPAIGWVIIGLSTSVSLALFIYAFRIKTQIPKIARASISEKLESKKEQAEKIHDNFMELEKKLWAVRDNLPQDTNTLDNAEVKSVLFDMHIEANKMARLVHKRDFDQLVDDLFLMYTKYLRFHINVFDSKIIDKISRIHRKIRTHVGNIKN